MAFVDLNILLTANGLSAPDLVCLHPDNSHYSALLFQPGGTVEIRNDYIGPGADQTIRNQLIDFFRKATERQVGLAVVPEYCCPIQTLQEIVSGAIRPANQAIWIVGVEAVNFQQLEHFRAALGLDVHVLWEQGLQTPQGRFLDPVFYIFWSQTTLGVSKLVIVVQFKTEPMADFTEIERQHMVPGTKIYVFNQSTPSRQKLSTLICSDSLSQQVQTQIAGIQDRCLIVHIQMNPDPRHDSFKLYRNSIFSRSSRETEILCLNWSTDVRTAAPNAFRNMRVAGTGIYLKSPHVDRPENDDLLRQNHRLGLYTTFWTGSHAFCFFFNFQTAVYYYNITKAFTLGNEAQWRRRGPQMAATLTWNETDSRWDEVQSLPDNFSVLCAGVDEQGLGHLHAPGYDPLNTERLVNLSVGIASEDDWFRVGNLRTYQIDATEKICRLTFAQERDQQIVQERETHLSNFNNLRNIVEQKTAWPIWLSNATEAVVLGYQTTNPNRNLSGDNDFTATGVFFGSHSEPSLEQLYQRLESLLAEETIRRLKQQAMNNQNQDAVYNQSQNAIAIWYHKNGQIILHRADVRPIITKVHTEMSSEIDRSPND